MDRRTISSNINIYTRGKYVAVEINTSDLSPILQSWMRKLCIPLVVKRFKRCPNVIAYLLIDCYEVNKWTYQYYFFQMTWAKSAAYSVRFLYCLKTCTVVNECLKVNARPKILKAIYKDSAKICSSIALVNNLQVYQLLCRFSGRDMDCLIC